MDTHTSSAGARNWFGASLVATLVFGLAAASASALLPQAKRGAPRRLADTGLYADFATRTVRADNLPYTPQYPLWSDGAHKQRWIHLPVGTSIDASDVDHWKFPIGTKLWKEFTFATRAETRYMERIEDGSWIYATYVWSDAANGVVDPATSSTTSDALLAPDCGVRAACVTTLGTRHDIPSAVDCRACHEGSPTRVLGFSALQLSSDRDPLAPHAEIPAQNALDLPTLVARGLVRGAPSDIVEHPPRIEAPSADERAALGYLYANCGGCHNSEGPLATLGLELDHRLNASSSPALRTTIGVESRFRGECEGPAVRVRAGDPEHSVLVARISTRFPAAQMPPIGTHAVDDEALALITRWIRDELATPRALADVTKSTAGAR